jgi:Mn2+/Fe2+ NRAMP family transporter
MKDYKMYWIIIWLIVLAFLLQTARLEYMIYNKNKYKYCDENLENYKIKEDIPLCLIEKD